MKKEWLLSSITVLLTIAISLLLVRSLAPHLLGIPIDLQMVGVSEKVPPFFENVFRPDDLKSAEYIIKDPYSGVRAQPLYPNRETMGPNDILGFRNYAVPNVADIVVIGDSQTYGNNSPIQMNWPSQMAATLNKKQRTTVYNMSVGGWGAVQYLYANVNATVFLPRVIVVAFYTGNDPLDSFRMVYNYDIWSELTPDPGLTPSDTPSLKLLTPESELWPVEFGDGVSTIFSPTLRYASNMEHPAVKAGYNIMADVSNRIVSMNLPRGVQVAFTIIPTKELVYELKIAMDSIVPPQEYIALISAEKANIEALKGRILEIEHATYIDVVHPLQQAAISSAELYPEDSNGHPIAQGYTVIADAISEVVEAMMPVRQEGFALMELGEGKYKPVLINQDEYWTFADSPNHSLIEKNGWSIRGAPITTWREVAGLEYAGLISEERPEKYGPQRR